MTADGDGPANGLQVTFDAEDPHRLARFWAAALHYEEEDHTAIVQGLVDAGRLPAGAVVATPGGGRGFADVAACRDPAGTRPRLLFQRVPEPEVAKNRMHLDLHVGPDRTDAEVARLRALGATPAWTSDDRGVRCVTRRDPEGNELCVS